MHLAGVEVQLMLAFSAAIYWKVWQQPAYGCGVSLGSAQFPPSSLMATVL